MRQVQEVNTRKKTRAKKVAEYNIEYIRATLQRALAFIQENVFRRKKSLKDGLR